MTNQIHFMTEPTRAAAHCVGLEFRLLNEHSFSIIGPP
jgi:hypothetical protein